MENCISLFFFLFVSISSVESQWPPDCKEDMIVDNICYKISLSATTYSNADLHCAFDKGLLAIVKNDVINKKIAALVKNDECVSRNNESTRVWIGLNDLVSEGNFKYSDETELKGDAYQPWAEGQPSGDYSSYSFTEDCVSMNTTTQQWYDDVCSTKKKFICQYKGRVCNIQDINISNAEYDNCYNNTEVEYGSEVYVQCHEGYIMMGTSPKCLADGRWSKMPRCLKGCKSPPFFHNANLIVWKEFYLINDIVTYLCKDGYFSNNNPKRSHFTIACSENGRWTPVQSGCSTAKKYRIKGLEVIPKSYIKIPCRVSELGSQINHETSNTKISLNNEGYMWLKDSKDLSSADLQYSIHPNTGDLTLNVNSTESIEGLYTCFLNGANILPGTVVYDVKRSGSFQCDDGHGDEIIHRTLKSGVSTIIYCPHNSSYRNFQWFKDNDYFPLNDDHILYPDGSLYIRQVEFYHQGIYTCMMTFKETFCSKNITIEVAVIAPAENLCGNPKKSKEHPWTVSLWWKDEVVPFCYGALIHELWIITTAQCLSSLYRKRTLSIYAHFETNNHVDSGKDKTKSVDIPVASVKIHPLYSKKRFVNDIGLVQLTHPVQFSNKIQPICLTQIDLTVKRLCDRSPPISGLATGWGSLKKDVSDEFILKEESMTFVSHDNCPLSETVYADKVICFKRSNGSSVTFASDYGSPLEVLWKDRIYLLGIYSWGDRIAHLGEHDYYTKISTYVPWISSFFRENYI